MPISAQAWTMTSVRAGRISFDKECVAFPLSKVRQRSAQSKAGGGIKLWPCPWGSPRRFK